MSPSDDPPAEDKVREYAGLAQELAGLLEVDRHPLPNAANMAALLYRRLPDVNWAGFYFRRDDELILGPFQGSPACVRIPLGKGVCGTSAARSKTLVVPDVHAFPGHIACDTQSRSEIVIPIRWQSGVVGVCDIDSPLPGRFDERDAVWLERCVEIFQSATDLEQWL